MGSTTLDASVNIKDLTEKLAATAAITDRDACFPSENLRLLGEHKFLGLLVPEEHGGHGSSAVEFARVSQAIGGACASTGMIFVMHCCGIDVIAKHLPSASGILQAAAKGEHLSTLACSERGTGANFYASNSLSEEKDGQFALSADKCFVTSGGFADSYVVATRAVASEDYLNTSLYLVESDNPALSFYGKWDGLGLRGNSSIGMKLENCLVVPEKLIGAQGQGFAIEMSTILPRFLLGAAAVYTGIAEAALASTINHMGSRSHSHSGEKLSMLPVLRNKIARMKVAVDSSTALMLNAAQVWQEGQEGALVMLLESKQLACRTALDVTALAMETCGGTAFTRVLPLERHLRDAQAGVLMAPTNDMLLDLIGRAALGLPLL